MIRFVFELDLRMVPDYYFIVSFTLDDLNLFLRLDL